MASSPVKGDLQVSLDYPDEANNVDLAADLENWMTNLPEQLRKLPLIHLAIPGSHDSGSYSITSRSSVSPDATDFLKRIKWLGLPVRYVTSKWAKTQGFDTELQLKSGVRFFDLRVSSKPNDTLQIVHSLYSGPVANILQAMNEYLNNHRNEVLILDFQHFYLMSEKDHSHLIELILAIFDQKIIPIHGIHIQHLTLEYLAENGFQVLIVYRTNHYKHPFFPSVCYPTPWPNTTSSKDLLRMLTKNLTVRNNAFGYVTQFVLTPSGYTLFKHIFGDLKSFSAKPLYSKHMDWVQQQTPGCFGVNVIIGDFIDIYEQDFCKIVVNLNRKLLKREDATPNMLPQITA